MTPEKNSWLKQKQIAEYLLSQSTRDGTLRSSPVTKTFEDGIRVGVEAAYSEIMAAPVAHCPHQEAKGQGTMTPEQTPTPKTIIKPEQHCQTHGYVFPKGRSCHKCRAPIPAPSPVAPEAPKATQGETEAPERIWCGDVDDGLGFQYLFDAGLDGVYTANKTEYIRADLVPKVRSCGHIQQNQYSEICITCYELKCQRERLEGERDALRERVKELESFLAPFKDLKGDL